MNQFAEPLILGGRSRKKLARLRPWVVLVAPVAAVLFQVYVPLYVPLVGYLELPLLAVVYLGFSRRGEISGLLIGAGVGLVQDCLSAHPIGIFGIVKTLAGYIAGTLAARLDTEHPLVRFFLGVSFFLFHQVMYWVLQRMLLNSAVGLGILPLLLAAVANGLLAVPLFFLLDKLRDTG